MKNRLGSKKIWVVVAVFALLVGAYAYLRFTSYKQRRDIAAVREYVNRVQPQLAADSRFKNVRLLGYSCDDSVKHPYIPVTGTVASQPDWEALESFIRDSKPPVFLSVRTVGIGQNNEPAR